MEELLLHCNDSVKNSNEVQVKVKCVGVKLEISQSVQHWMREPPWLNE